MTTAMDKALLRLTVASGVTVVLLVGAASAVSAKDLLVVGKPPVDEVRTERVAYGDLNLASVKGVSALNRRVRGAVRLVCVDFTAPYAKYACGQAAWAGAKPQIDLAITRAQEIAANGHSSIAPVAIRIAASR